MASWLQACGLRIDTGHVYGADVGNPLGLFEDADFVDLHRAAIDRHVPKAQGWIVTDRTRITPDAILREGAEQLLIARAHQSEPWGWKDPRTALFLDFWKGCVPGLKVLIVWRPGLAVIDSIRRRARKSRSPHYRVNLLRSLDLWKRHNQALLNYKRTHAADTLLVRTDSAIEHDAQLIAAINEKLGIPLHAVPASRVYRPELLAPPSTSLWRRSVARTKGIAGLERELAAASDPL